MHKTLEQRLRKQIKIWIILFITGLVISGITAFPIELQLQFAMDNPNLVPEFMMAWIAQVYEGVIQTNENYPFIAYGTDWLAFAHIVIGIAFIGPLRDPVRNIWVIQFGMIACALVIPLALIAGSIRGIPFYWQVIDCSFGVFGILPLYIVHRKIRLLESIQKSNT